MPDLQTPAQPFTAPADLLTELADIDAITAEVFGADVPLRDRVATLVADWQDGDAVVMCHKLIALSESAASAANRRVYERRGIAGMAS